MRRMFIFHNYPDLHTMLGETNVRFTQTEDELARALLDVDMAVCRKDFAGGIPTSNLVEMYVKRADSEQPGTGGNDWVFANAWCAPVSRERAVELYYAAYSGMKRDGQ